MMHGAAAAALARSAAARITARRGLYNPPVSWDKLPLGKDAVSTPP